MEGLRIKEFLAREGARLGIRTQEELASALALPNAVPVTLGPNVLRVETAALCGVSATLALAL